MYDENEVLAKQSAEAILLDCSPEVQEVVKATLRLALTSATGSGSITKDDVVEIIRNAVK